MAVLASVAATLLVNVLTYQYDNTRAGVNSQEVILTPANVNASQFGKLFSRSVDGALYGCAFHPDGEHLVAYGDNGVYFLRLVV